jgi:hypothetical protein
MYNAHGVQTLQIKQRLEVYTVMTVNICISTVITSPKLVSLNAMEHDHVGMTFSALPNG